jgi:hypothetical protein
MAGLFLGTPDPDGLDTLAHFIRDWTESRLEGQNCLNIGWYSRGHYTV